MVEQDSEWKDGGNVILQMNKDGLDFGRLWRIKKENIGKDARS